jgi:hypothetical protein
MVGVAGCGEPRAPGAAAPTGAPSPSVVVAPTARPVEPAVVEVAEGQDGANEPEPVVPPEKLPEFDPALVRDLGPQGVAKLEVAASLCDATFRREGGKVRVGCRSCPPFSKQYGPDGTIPESASGDLYELEHVTFGAFTRAGADEVAAVFSGCEPYAGNYGGTMIAERREKGGSVWVARAYHSGIHPASCEPFPLNDGRQLLVCEWTTGKQTTSHLLMVYDFAASDTDSDPIGRDAFGVYDNVFSSCMGARPGFHIVAGEIDRFRVEPSSAGVGKVVVDVTMGAMLPTKAFEKACRAANDALDRDVPATVDPAKLLPKRKHRLVFVWNGTQLVLDPPSAARWAAAVPKDPDENE